MERDVSIISTSPFLNEILWFPTIWSKNSNIWKEIHLKQYIIIGIYVRFREGNIMFSVIDQLFACCFLLKQHRRQSPKTRHACCSTDIWTGPKKHQQWSWPRTSANLAEGAPSFPNIALCRCEREQVFRFNWRLGKSRRNGSRAAGGPLTFDLSCRLFLHVFLHSWIDSMFQFIQLQALSVVNWVITPIYPPWN